MFHFLVGKECLPVMRTELFPFPVPKRVTSCAKNDFSIEERNRFISFSERNDILFQQ
jgi:hypothetical protein